VERYAVGSQPLEMDNSLRHPFSAEAVQGPKQHTIELALGRIIEQSRELLSLLCSLSAALGLHVLSGNRMA
jgi:hypothetical protein